MANNLIKPIKVLSDIALKQEAQAKQGLTISGSIKDSGGVGLHVEECAIFDKGIAVNGLACAEGFTQVGALDIVGLLQVHGHLAATETLEISGSSNFKEITQVQRDSQGLYFVGEAIQALDDRFFSFRDRVNENKRKYDAFPSVNGITEIESHFLWEDAEYISIDVMVYYPSRNSWNNDLISVEMKESINGKVVFFITTPDITDPNIEPNTRIRIIATLQNDINFS